MKRLLTILAFIIVAITSNAQQHYKPSLHAGPQNKPSGISSATPLDSRSYFYDTLTFSYRPYANRAEVLSYLYLASYRSGQFTIIIDSISKKWAYWFRNCTNDTCLVLQYNFAASTTDSSVFATLYRVDTAKANLRTSIAGKISTTLPAGQILVGNLSNVATPVTPSNDVSVTSGGSFTVLNQLKTASNGLTASAGNLKLGGTLTDANTTLLGNVGTENLLFTNIHNFDTRYVLRTKIFSDAGQATALFAPTYIDLTGGDSVGVESPTALFSVKALASKFYHKVTISDTTTITTMGLLDSSDRAASTAWVKRQGYGSGGGGGGGISNLNGLTAATQAFVTGTTGTDFGISSSGSTHTFNWPIASGTNTGKLSNTDWTTFNNKQPAGNYITALTGRGTAAGPGSSVFTLANSGVTAGTYTNATVTISADGTVSAASNGSAGGGITTASNNLQVIGTDVRDKDTISSSKRFNKDVIIGAPPTIAGTLLNQSFAVGSLPAIYTATTATVTITFPGTYMDVTGGTNNTNDYIVLNQHTGRTQWKKSIRFTAIDSTSSSYGVAIGTNSTSTFFSASIFAYFDLRAATRGTITLLEGQNIAGTVLSTSPAIKINNNDSLLGTIERLDNVYVATLTNLATGAKTTATYGPPIGMSYESNSGQFMLWFVGGHQHYMLDKIESNERMGGTVVIGNSITAGFNASSITTSYVGTMFPDRRFYNISGGPGDKSADVVFNLAELGTLGAQYALLNIGVNDAQALVTTPTFSVNVNRILDSLSLHSITAIIVSACPNNSVDLTPYNDTLNAIATRRSLKYINTFDILRSGTGWKAQYQSDGIHPNDAGHYAIAAKIMADAPEILPTSTYSTYINNAIASGINDEFLRIGVDNKVTKSSMRDIPFLYGNNTYTNINAFNGSYTASATLSGSTIISPIINFIADNQKMAALWITPTFNNGGHLGLEAWSFKNDGQYAKLGQNVCVNCTVPTTFNFLTNGDAKITGTLSVGSGLSIDGIANNRMSGPYGYVELYNPGTGCTTLASTQTADQYGQLHLIAGNALTMVGYTNGKWQIGSPVVVSSNTTLDPGQLIVKNVFDSVALNLFGRLKLSGVPNGLSTDTLLVIRADSIVGKISSSVFATQSALSDTAAALRAAIGSGGSDTLKLAFVGTGERPFYANIDTLFGKTIKGLGSVSVISDTDSTINVQLTGFTSGRIPFSSSSSVLTDNANLKWDATGNTLVIGGSGGTFTQNIFTTGNSASGNWGNSGGQRNTLSGGTFTDNTTAGSGSKTYWFGDYFTGPTFAATNSSVTYNNISTAAFVAPTAGTNITATHRFALRTFDNSAGSGNMLVDGGAFMGGGVYQKLITITSNYTATSSDYQLLVDATSGNITITLPAVSSVYDATLGTGIIYSIKRMDASGNTITVQRAGSDTIDGATSFTLTTQYQSKSIQAGPSSAWYVY